MKRDRKDMVVDVIKRNKKALKIWACISVVGIIISICFTYGYWHEHQIDGIKEINPNEDLIFMGTKLDEDRTIDVDESVSIWHPELTPLGIIKELTPMSDTVELLDAMYGILSDNADKRDVSKIKEVTIPAKASYLPVNKKSANEAEYYSKLGNNLNFNLFQMDVEMYAWVENYRLYSKKEITNKYVIMIFDRMMIQGKLYFEDGTKLGMEIIRYQISE